MQQGRRAARAPALWARRPSTLAPLSLCLVRSSAPRGDASHMHRRGAAAAHGVEEGCSASLWLRARQALPRTARQLSCAPRSSHGPLWRARASVAAAVQGRRRRCGRDADAAALSRCRRGARRALQALGAALLLSCVVALLSDECGDAAVLVPSAHAHTHAAHRPGEQRVPLAPPPPHLPTTDATPCRLSERAILLPRRRVCGARRGAR